MTSSPYADHAADREREPSDAKTFPTRENGKEPAVAGGFHSATADTAQHHRWAEENPSYNVALALEHHWVLDMDPKNGGDATLDGLILANSDLPPTWTVRTPSGGRHYYFAGPPFPAQTAGTKLGPGLDTRTPGKGYVLISPSVIDGKPYEVIDASPPAKLAEDHWLLQLLRARKREPAKAPPGAEPDQSQNIARLSDWLDRQPIVPEGQRNGATYKAACEAHNQGVSEETALPMIKERLRCDPPLDDEEIETTVASAYRTAQNEFGAHGLSGTAEEAFAPALSKLKLTAPDEPEEQDRLNRLRGRSILEWKDKPPLQYWDRGKTLPNVPGGCVGVIYGPSGAGKTTVILALIGEVIRAGGRVLYVAGEGAYGFATQRIAALAESLRMTVAELAKFVRIVPEGVNLRTDDEVTALIAANRDWAPDGVILDTLSTMIAGEDENSAAVASAAIRAMRRIAAEINPAGALVPAIHHTGKDETRGARGSGGLTANADFVGRLKANKEAGTAVLRVEKMRDGPDGHDVPYKITPASNGVPVATRIEPGELAALTAATRTPLRLEIGATLRDMGAVGPENAVATAMLSAELVKRRAAKEPERYKPETYEKDVSSAADSLSRAVRDGKLVAYVLHGPLGEPDKPYRWAMPTGGDDDV